MKLSPRFDRHDVAPVVDLIERPIERSDEFAGGCSFEGDFVVSPFWNDENNPSANLNLGRGTPEIARTHTRSPDTSIRLPENCDSFVMNGNLTCINHFASEPLLDANGAQVGTQACAPTLSGPEHRCPTRSGPFSIARTP